jgi:dsDNA-specific endonuclease/ATPase MutS2
MPTSIDSKLDTIIEDIHSMREDIIKISKSMEFTEFRIKKLEDKVIDISSDIEILKVEVEKRKAIKGLIITFITSLTIIISASMFYMEYNKVQQDKINQIALKTSNPNDIAEINNLKNILYRKYSDK